MSGSRVWEGGGAYAGAAALVDGAKPVGAPPARAGWPLWQDSLSPGENHSTAPRSSTYSLKPAQPASGNNNSRAQSRLMAAPIRASGKRSERRAYTKGR